MSRQVVIAIVLLLAVSATAWWLLSGGEPEPDPEPPPVSAPEPVAAETEPPAPELPGLDASDPLARELAGDAGLSGDLAAALLAQPDLIERFVRVVDAIASGSSPARDLAVLGPEEPFEVSEEGEALHVDPASYRRYDGVAAAVAGVDAEAAANAFRRIEPLADRVYSDTVGQPRAFRPVFVRALEVLLEVPIVSDPPELTDAIESYRYVDENLERLSLPQKHLLRMGPANVGRIQARLRQLARLLE